MAVRRAAIECQRVEKVALHYRVAARVVHLQQRRDTQSIRARLSAHVPRPLRVRRESECSSCSTAARLRLACMSDQRARR